MNWGFEPRVWGDKSKVCGKIEESADALPVQDDILDIVYMVAVGMGIVANHCSVVG